MNVAASRQTDDFPSHRVDVDAVVSRAGRQARHRANGAQQRKHKARATVDANLANRHGESARGPLQGRVVREAVLSLCHADGETAVAKPLELSELLPDVA